MCIHCDNSSKPEREIMGEFAEFCKGEQMGAFLPLLLPAGPAIRRLDQDLCRSALKIPTSVHSGNLGFQDNLMAEPFQTLNQMVRKPFDLTLLEVIGTQVDEDSPFLQHVVDNPQNRVRQGD